VVWCLFIRVLLLLNRRDRGIWIIRVIGEIDYVG
jgi:hypothetical protein